jgi:hypothetical protein
MTTQVTGRVVAVEGAMAEYLRQTVHQRFSPAERFLLDI